MKWYLAGPMTGIPQFNIPQFDEAAELLRAAGFDIVSPAERDTYETRSSALKSKDGKHDHTLVTAESYGDMLSRDMKIIADEVGGLILLDGWESSTGARLEVYVALVLGKKFGKFVNKSTGPFLPLRPDVIKEWLIFGIKGL